MIDCQFPLPPSFVSRPSSYVPRKQRKAAGGRFSLATGDDTGVTSPVAPSMPKGIGGRFPQKAQSPSEGKTLALALSPKLAQPIVNSGFSKVTIV